jgi:hypothetical protein
MRAGLIPVLPQLSEHRWLLPMQFRLLMNPADELSANSPASTC